MKPGDLDRAIEAIADFDLEDGEEDEDEEDDFDFDEAPEGPILTCTQPFTEW